jgi:surface carbohydrate biosynthesis protein
VAKQRISIIVDHPLRDLPGVSLTGLALAQLGFDVFLVPMDVEERECLSLAPDFVLLNYLRKNNESFVRRLLECGIQYGINDTEGGFYGDLSYYAKVLSQDSELYENLRCNTIWGMKMLNYLKSEFPHKQNLILTGLPRFDYYSEKYRNLELNLLPKNLHGRNIALINTKVALVNPLFVSVEREIDLYKNKLGFSDEVIQHFIEFGKYSIQDNIELAKNLSREMKDIQVIIRPHPHENERTYSNSIDAFAFPNVSVFREGPVIPWILGSKSVIHRHCTTAIEAALAGKPALAPSWVRTSANAPDAEKVSHHVGSEQELKDLIQLSNNDQLKPTDSIKNELSRIVEDWLFQVDGDSHKRVANAIADNLKPGLHPNKDKARRQMYRIFDNRNDPMGRIYSALNTLGEKNLFPAWKAEKIRLAKWSKTQKYFEPQDVKNWIEPVIKQDNTAAVDIAWARETGEYMDSYPGSAVKISLKGTK